MTEHTSRILVPVDFSRHAERACAYATDLARRLGATVTLVHVVEDPYTTGAWTSEVYVPNIGEVLEALTSAASRQLADLKDAAAAGTVPIDTAVLSGRPADAIVDYAARGGFELIVMGTHGRTGLSHAVMGSVAEQVMRRAPCPVVTLRAGAAETSGRTAA